MRIVFSFLSNNQSNIIKGTGGIIGPHYASSKSAMHGLMHWISMRHAKDGVVSFFRGSTVVTQTHNQMHSRRVTPSLLQLIKGLSFTRFTFFFQLNYSILRDDNDGQCSRRACSTPLCSPDQLLVSLIRLLLATYSCWEVRSPRRYCLRRGDACAKFIHD